MFPKKNLTVKISINLVFPSTLWMEGLMRSN